MIERRHIQNIGAALSRRDWHATECAYNELRDEFDRTGAADRIDALTAENAALRSDLAALDDVSGRAADADHAMLLAAKHLARVEALEKALTHIVAVYDRDNPMRTADCHSPNCTCMRCAVDDARAALSPEGTL